MFRKYVLAVLSTVALTTSLLVAPPATALEASPDDTATATVQAEYEGLELEEIVEKGLAKECLGVERVEVDADGVEIAVEAAIVMGGAIALEAAKAVVAHIIADYNRRSSSQRHDYYPAIRSGSKVFINANGLSSAQAQNRGRAGQDVWAITQHRAKGIGKDAQSVWQAHRGGEAQRWLFVALPPGLLPSAHAQLLRRPGVSGHSVQGSGCGRWRLVSVRTYPEARLERRMGSYDALLSGAREHFGVEPAVTLTDVVGLLRSLGAVPFDFNGYRDDLLDEFVDRDFVVGAYTLADPSLLRRRATVEEIEHFTADPDEEFDPLEYGVEQAERTLLFREIEILARLIIILEHDRESAELVGNLRVYGAGQWLRETLWAASGIVPRDAAPGPQESEVFGCAFAHVGRSRFEAAPLMWRLCKQLCPRRPTRAISPWVAGPCGGRSGWSPRLLKQ